MKKICQECNKPFKPKRSSATFCKESCRVNFFQKQKRKAQKQKALEENLQQCEEKLTQADIDLAELTGRTKYLQEHTEKSRQDINYYQQQLALDYLTFHNKHILTEGAHSTGKDNALAQGLKLGITIIAAVKGPELQQQKRKSFMLQKIIKHQQLQQLQLQLSEIKQEKENLEAHVEQLEKQKASFEQTLLKLLPPKEVLALPAKAPVQRQKKSQLSGIGAADLLKQTFDTFTLPGELGRFLGKLERQMLAIGLVGDPGAGKSTLSLGLAQLFVKADMSVIYYSLELGIGEVFKSMLERYPVSNRMRIEKKGSLEEVRQSAKEFDCVIIDSFGKLGCKAEELDRLRNDFPDTLFLFILQKTTQGGSRGGAAINYDCSMVIDVIKRDEQRVAIMKKSRYGTIGWEYAPDTDEIIKS